MLARRILAWGAATRTVLVRILVRSRLTLVRSTWMRRLRSALLRRWPLLARSR